MKIINLLNHQLTPEQREELKVYGELAPFSSPALEAAKNIDPAAPSIQLEELADWLAEELAEELPMYLIGPVGSPAYWHLFTKSIKKKLDQVNFLYASSKREVVEHSNPDGSATKTSVFRHVQWVLVP